MARLIGMWLFIPHLRPAIPSALLIGDHYHLTLPYGGFSDMLHEQSDEECLECAREMRLVLTDLVE